jgi:hypothetical protein
MARKLGLTSVAVGDWKLGKRKPGPDQRRQLELVYQIAATTWDNVVGVRAVPPPIPLAAPVADGEPDLFADVDAVIANCRRGLAAGGLLPSEQAAWQERMLKALATRQKMSNEADVREDKVVRYNPRWQTVRQRIAEALAPFPKAAAAVVEVLAELDA